LARTRALCSLRTPSLAAESGLDRPTPSPPALTQVATVLLDAVAAPVMALLAARTFAAVGSSMVTHVIAP